MIIAHDEAEAAKIISELTSANDKLDTNAVNSRKELESNLSGWSGQASTSMGESNNATYNNINDCSETWKGMAEYLEEYSAGIEAIEDMHSNDTI